MTPAGRPRAEVQQQPPTDAERRAGLFFECPSCEHEWSLKFKHPREGQLCLSCGRTLGRERKQAQRARARGEDAPTPSTPRNTKTEPIAGKRVEVEDFVEHPDPESLSEIDRIVQQATRKKPPKKPGTGVVKR